MGQHVPPAHACSRATTPPPQSDRAEHDRHPRVARPAGQLSRADILLLPRNRLAARCHVVRGRAAQRCGSRRGGEGRGGLVSHGEAWKGDDRGRPCSCELAVICPCHQLTGVPASRRERLARHLESVPSGVAHISSESSDMPPPSGLIAGRRFSAFHACHAAVEPDIEGLHRGVSGLSARGEREAEHIERRISELSTGTTLLPQLG